jgi:hypothetical protein
MSDKDFIEFDEYGDIVSKAKGAKGFQPEPVLSRDRPPARQEPVPSTGLVNMFAIVGSIVMVLLCFGVGGFFVLMRMLNEPTEVLVPSDGTETAFAELSPTNTSQVPTVTPVIVVVSSTPVPEPRPDFGWSNIGQSVQGRDISMAMAGYEGKVAIVVVGSIEGEQEPTHDLVNALVNYYQQNHGQIPDSVTFYLIPSINPDGSTSGSRYNANGVDLNRNWGTSDWKSNAAVPGYPNGKTGAGGNYPFSEPETRALRDLLLRLKSSTSRLQVVILHSSVHRSGGEVYPSGSSSENVARVYANAANYDIKYGWDQYTTSGEAITWCDEQGIVAIDIVFPATQVPLSKVYGNLTLLDVTVQALEAIADYR